MRTLRDRLAVAVTVLSLAAFVAAMVLLACGIGGLMFSASLAMHTAGMARAACVFLGIPWLWVLCNLAAWVRENIKQQAEERLGGEESHE